jgi:hypothetical protein
MNDNSNLGDTRHFRAYAILVFAALLWACGIGSPSPAGRPPGGAPRTGGPIAQIPECADAGPELVPVIVTSSSGTACVQRCAPAAALKYICTDIEHFAEVPKMWNSDGSERLIGYGKTLETRQDLDCPGNFRIWELSAGAQFFAFDSALADVDMKGVQVGVGSDCSGSQMVHDYLKNHPARERTRWYSIQARVIPEL